MYPTNIKIEKISKIKIVKGKLIYLKNKIKRTFKYILYDRANFGKIIKVKLHI